MDMTEQHRTIAKTLLLVVFTCSLFLRVTSVAVSQVTTVCWTRGGQYKQVNNVTYYFYSLVRCVQGDPHQWLYNETQQLQNTFLIIGTDSSYKMKSFVYAMSFDYGNRRLYYNDIAFKCIQMFQLPSSYVPNYVTQPGIVYDGSSSQVNGLSFDWSSGVMYWADSAYGWIAAASFSIAQQKYFYKYLIMTALDKPRDVAVYPKKGYLYWTSWGSQPKLERADLDGANRMILITVSGRPYGLTIDFDTDQLLWVDQMAETIEISDLLGGNRSYIQLEVGDIPGQIDIYQELIFVTDLANDRVVVYNRTTGLYLTSLDNQINTYGLTVYDGNRQPNTSSNCSRLNCEYMCLNSPSGAHCACPEGYTMNSTVCIKDDFSKPAYFVVVTNLICAVAVKITDQSSSPNANIQCFIKNPNNIETIAVDSRGNRIFYVDNVAKIIYRAPINLNVVANGQNGRIITGNRGKVLGLAVDYAGELLYWTDNILNHIMVSKLDGRFPKILIQNVPGPQSIEVDLQTTSIFWTTVDGVYTAPMSGSTFRRLYSLSNVAYPYGLAIQQIPSIGRRLYWTNKNTTDFSMAYLDLTTKVSSPFVTSVKTSKFVRDITFYQDYMLWVDGTNNVYFSQYNQGNTNSLQTTKTLTFNVSYPISEIIAFADPPPYPAVCTLTNTRCAQLCFATGNMSSAGTSQTPQLSCQCGLGFQLASDNYTCTSTLQTDDFILLVDSAQRLLLQLPTNQNPYQSYPQGINIFNFESPQVVDYDPVTQRVYWVDYNTESNVTVYNSIDLNATNERLEKQLPGKQISYFAVYNGRVYIANTTNIISIHDSRSVYTSGGQILPSTLIVNKNTGRLYWGEYGSIVVKYQDLSSGNWKGTTLVTVSADNVNVSDIIGLSVEEYDNYIYLWTRNDILAVNVTTGAYRLVYTTTDFNITSVVSAGCRIYVSSVNLEYIFQLDLQTLASDGTGFASPVRYTKSVFGQVNSMVSVHGFNPNVTARCFIYIPEMTTVPSTSTTVQTITTKSTVIATTPPTTTSTRPPPSPATTGPPPSQSATGPPPATGLPPSTTGPPPPPTSGSSPTLLSTGPPPSSTVASSASSASSTSSVPLTGSVSITQATASPASGGSSTTQSSMTISALPSTSSLSIETSPLSFTASAPPRTTTTQAPSSTQPGSSTTTIVTPSSEHSSTAVLTSTSNVSIVGISARSKDSGGIGRGGIAAIALFVIALFVGIIMLGIWFYVYRYRNGQSPPYSPYVHYETNQIENPLYFATPIEAATTEDQSYNIAEAPEATVALEPPYSDKNTAFVNPLSGRAVDQDINLNDIEPTYSEVGEEGTIVLSDRKTLVYDDDC